MTLLYAKDIRKRLTTNIVGTSLFRSRDDIENLDKVKHDMEERIKYGYQYFVLDDDSNRLIQKSLESARSRANLKNMQTSFFKPLLEAINTKNPEVIRDIREEINRPIPQPVQQPVPEQPPQPVPQQAEGIGIKKMDNIRNILNKMKKEGLGKKKGCGLVEL